jgi:hypothetical protein
LIISREQLIYNQEIILVWDVVAAELANQMDVKAMGVAVQADATV